MAEKNMPALSYFLENSTFDMQRDAIRAYAQQYAEQRVREEREADMELMRMALDALKLNASWPFPRQREDAIAALRARVEG